MVVQRSDRLSQGSSDQEDSRNVFARDRDRILYSQPFRRLGGVTQVISPTDHHVYHSRLTHSLKVAQISRRLAERFLRNAEQWPADRRSALQQHLDPEVAEAAALAHDLGHPPFGHAGEEELKILVPRHDGADSFEGNAQSFRIVTRLSVRRSTQHGLDLSRATLNAVLKYPWLPATNAKKFGAYTSETIPFGFAREGVSNTDPSLEASIMDLADDITYSIHDMEDFYRAGLIPLDRLCASQDSDELKRFATYAAKKLSKPWPQLTADAICQLVFQLFWPARGHLSHPFDGSREMVGALQALGSRTISRFVENARVTESALRLERDEQQSQEVDVLKLLTWFYVIERSSLAGVQHGQRKVVRFLYETFRDALDTQNLDVRREILPPVASLSVVDEDTTTKQGLAQAAADAVCGLTDSQAVACYCRLSGMNPGTIFDLLIEGGA